MDYAVKAPCHWEQLSLHSVIKDQIGVNRMSGGQFLPRTIARSDPGQLLIGLVPTRDRSFVRIGSILEQRRHEKQPVVGRSNRIHLITYIESLFTYSIIIRIQTLLRLHFS
jgi:hypothetical protein